MAAKPGKPNAALQARIKRMMQSDEDVGKVAKASPVLIARALDIFLENVVGGAAAMAAERGAKMLTPSHIKAHIQGEVTLDFLKDLVEAVPDLPPPGSEPAKPQRQKRQRAKSATDGDEDSGQPKARSRGARGGGGGGGKGGRVRGKKGAASAGEAAPAEGEQAAPPEGMDVDAAGQAEEQQAAAEGSAGQADASAGAEQQQQQQPQQEQEQEQEDQQSAGDEAGQAADRGSEGAADMPLPVSVPGFLAASAAVPGAEAEEEDYDA